MNARPLEEWTEADGNVVWWAWDADNEELLGEPAYIGSPLDLGYPVEVEFRTREGEFVHTYNVGGWPGYHTHWTPHPEFPESLKVIPTLDDEKSILSRLMSGDSIAYSRDGDTAWFMRGNKAWVGDTIIQMRKDDLLWRAGDDRDYISSHGVDVYREKYGAKAE